LPAAARGTLRRRAHGATLIDVLVGLCIAIFTMAVAYQAFVVLQTLRLNAAAAADAHGNGAFALSALAIQAGNAGAGLGSAARWLESCPPTADITTTLRPVVALITDGGAPDRPDSLVVRQSLAPDAAPAAFITEAPAGSAFRVQGIGGFAVGDRVIAISRSGTCVTSEVTGIASGGPGILDISHAPLAVDLPITSVLLNLGPTARASTARYDIASGSLRSTDVTNGDAPNPLISNIAHLKLQYGIDSDGDGTLDTWVGAHPADGFDAATLLAAPLATLERIKALRIGVIARTERPDRSRTDAYPWVLFDCELADKSACPGRLEGTIAATSSGGYRYRALETVVALRNATWNRTP
jgi:type IV pilus assembly PilW-like protein